MLAAARCGGGLASLPAAARLRRTSTRHDCRARGGTNAVNANATSCESEWGIYAPHMRRDRGAELRGDSRSRALRSRNGAGSDPLVSYL
jgi:hypothetical protein